MNQGIGHASHRRDDDAQTPLVAAQQNTGYLAKMFLVSEATAPELMDFPATIHHCRMCPARKSMHSNGPYLRRRLFYLQPKIKWWGV